MQTRWFDLVSAARPAALGLAALTIAASTAHAQYADRRSGGYATRPAEVFEWEGRVDREIRLQLRGNRARVQRDASNHEIDYGSGRLLRRLPREEGVLRVRRLEGRGDVDVVQQPSASNNYTAILRLRDPRSGTGHYHVVAYWQPTRDRYARRSDDDRRRGRDGWYSDDDRWDDDDRDDRRGRWETQRNP